MVSSLSQVMEPPDRPCFDLFLASTVKPLTYNVCLVHKIAPSPSCDY
jgi:hypothetical protein